MIEEVATGRRIPTVVRPVAPRDSRKLGAGWQFDWRAEARLGEVYKLVAVDAPGVILGLISIRRERGYVEVRLLESSPPNVGRRKTLDGIAGSLLAFAAGISVVDGNSGLLLLESKTSLIPHYQKAYGFLRIGRSHRLLLDADCAVRLIASYQGD
jgi:hypothetical protein